MSTIALTPSLKRLSPMTPSRPQSPSKKAKTSLIVGTSKPQPDHVPETQDERLVLQGESPEPLMAAEIAQMTDEEFARFCTEGEGWTINEEYYNKRNNRSVLQLTWELRKVEREVWEISKEEFAVLMALTADVQFVNAVRLMGEMGGDEGVDDLEDGLGPVLDINDCMDKTVLWDDFGDLPEVSLSDIAISNACVIGEPAQNSDLDELFDADGLQW